MSVHSFDTFDLSPAVEHTGCNKTLMSARKYLTRLILDFYYYNYLLLSYPLSIRQKNDHLSGSPCFIHFLSPWVWCSRKMATVWMWSADMRTDPTILTQALHWHHHSCACSILQTCSANFWGRSLLTLHMDTSYARQPSCVCVVKKHVWHRPKCWNAHGEFLQCWCTEFGTFTFSKVFEAFLLILTIILDHLL